MNTRLTVTALAALAFVVLLNAASIPAQTHTPEIIAAGATIEHTVPVELTQIGMVEFR
ncbi:MAG: hypothetical protein ACKVQA_06240 [Burkholderiales bacterium]